MNYCLKLVLDQKRHTLAFIIFYLTILNVNSKSAALTRDEKTSYSLKFFNNNSNLENSFNKFEITSFLDIIELKQRDPKTYNKNTLRISSVKNQHPQVETSSALTSHYQVITICNTLPSILKCQNKQNFLILHRVIYGISDYRELNECVAKVDCLKNDERDEFNCTGLNTCVFYPYDRYLHTCHSAKSNLTQIHITCVNLCKFENLVLSLSF
jgi:hypothetical protein